MSDTEISVGQWWTSKDPRDNGKRVQVIAVDSAFVYVKGFVRSRIRRENMLKLYRPS